MTKELEISKEKLYTLEQAWENAAAVGTEIYIYIYRYIYLVVDTSTCSGVQDVSSDHCDFAIGYVSISKSSNVGLVLSSGETGFRSHLAAASFIISSHTYIYLYQYMHTQGNSPVAAFFFLLFFSLAIKLSCRNWLASAEVNSRMSAVGNSSRLSDR